jgi:hypothetical protein
MMKTTLLMLAIGNTVYAHAKRMLRNKNRFNVDQSEFKAVQAEDVVFWMRDLQMGR